MLSAVNNQLYFGYENYSSNVDYRENDESKDLLFGEVVWPYLSVMRETLPQPNSMKSCYYDIKKQIVRPRLPLERIDRWIHGCMIYQGRTTNARCCQTCSTIRWIRDDVVFKHILRKQFIYLSIGLWLQRLYASQVTAGEIRWHAEHHKEERGMCHPSDSKAWLNFNATHPEFSAKTRNMRLDFCTYGFNPFWNSRRQYWLWPVILSPYKLPPWKCMKTSYMFLTVIAPGLNNLIKKHQLLLATYDWRT